MRVISLSVRSEGCVMSTATSREKRLLDRGRARLSVYPHYSNHVPRTAIEQIRPTIHKEIARKASSEVSCGGLERVPTLPVGRELLRWKSFARSPRSGHGTSAVSEAFFATTCYGRR